MQLSTSKYLEEKVASEAEESALTTALPRRKAKWTMGLTVVCGLFFLFGTLAIANGVFGFIGLFEDPEIEARAIMEQGLPRATETSLLEVHDKTMAARDKYLPALIYIELFKIGLAIALIVSVALMASRNPRGRSLAFALCGFAIFFHVCSIGVSLLVLNSTGGVYNDFLSQTFNDAVASAGLSTEEKAEAEMAFSSAIGSAAIFGMGIVMFCRLIFWGGIMMYLNLETIKSVFGEDLLKEDRQQLANFQETGMHPAV